MFFNSFTFLYFLVVVYGVYVLLRHRHKAQNYWLLAASYFFYGYWDWRFCSLLMLSTVVDYNLGKMMGATEDARRRKGLILISLVVNLSILGFFKYFNFFEGSLVSFLHLFGMQPDFVTLHVVLPVGISFYTFQTLSYTIDVYRRELEPVRRLEDFALYIAFFPQLVAGPIERATRLLPQVQSSRTISASRLDEGLYLILWGLYKKVVIADNMAHIANPIFNGDGATGIDLWIGTVAFAFQIYGDFSGYTDIARGVSKLMGFELMLNFRLPYFAVNPSDFWSRWHISLSTWLRDYLYIPLGGNRGGRRKTYRNLMTTMLLGGLWHGAAWNFVFWGFYHGSLLCIHRLWTETRAAVAVVKRIPTAVRLSVGMVCMFFFTLVGWVFFRCHSAKQIGHFFTHASLSLGPHSLGRGYDVLFYAFPLICVQVWQHLSGDLAAPVKLRTPLRALWMSFIFLMILVFGVRESIEFIYFQF